MNIEALSYESLMTAYQEQTRQLEAVVAECAAFKSAHPQPFGPLMMQALDAYEKHQDDVPETGMLNAFFILRDSIAVETPTTDSAPAEVEAKAIEKAIERITILMNHQAPAVAQVINTLQMYAKALREGRV